MRKSGLYIYEKVASNRAELADDVGLRAVACDVVHVFGDLTTFNACLSTQGTGDGKLGAVHHLMFLI
jgi:hypothetical protein